MSKDKAVIFREKSEIVEKINRIAEEKGIHRSGFIRQTLREKLKEIESRG